MKEQSPEKRNHQRSRGEPDQVEALNRWSPEPRPTNWADAGAESPRDTGDSMRRGAGEGGREEERGVSVPRRAGGCRGELGSGEERRGEGREGGYRYRRESRRGGVGIGFGTSSPGQTQE
uniref:Uncharacterized protein n=2 Tax=Oryza sativa subsp. japonica TaxID=39947 RepID=Q69S06_ORYSJ|nr:hypothetical protein [Oryza sativa Japonica Group]BAD30977.1 hypothetical protein [Oryza sativa Japonica Group]